MSSELPRLALVPLALALLLPAAGCDRPRPVRFPTCQDTGEAITFDSAPTWHEDVSPIVQRRCAGCHAPGGHAPMSLLEFENSELFAPIMAGRTGRREMPPPGPTSCGECRTFRNARWLTPEEIATIGAWADAGAPEGDPAAAVDLEPAVDVLDRVDLVVEMEQEYVPTPSPESEEDDYRCFVIDPQLQQDRWLTGFQVRPGDLDLVHHVILYAPSSEDQALTARALDEADPGYGYGCFGGAGVGASPVAGWAPGLGASLYPEQTGISLPAGRPFIMQVHYHLDDTGEGDRSLIDLRLEDSVAAPASLISVGDYRFELDPGEAEVSSESVVGSIAPGFTEIVLWGVLPHMHTLGVSLRSEAWKGRRHECLVDVPSWDFSWQGLFFYDEPVVIGGDWRVAVECTWDTRGRQEVVTYGEGTSDEMCIAFFYATAVVP